MKRIMIGEIFFRFAIGGAILGAIHGLILIYVYWIFSILFFSVGGFILGIANALNISIYIVIYDKIPKLVTTAISIALSVLLSFLIYYYIFNPIVVNRDQDRTVNIVLVFVIPLNIIITILITKTLRFVSTELSGVS